jgi:hypothetical protein
MKDRQADVSPTAIAAKTLDDGISVWDEKKQP